MINDKQSFYNRQIIHRIEWKGNPIMKKVSLVTNLLHSTCDGAHWEIFAFEFGKGLRTTTTITTTTFTFEILNFLEPHMDGGALGDLSFEFCKGLRTTTTTITIEILKFQTTCDGALGKSSIRLR